MPQSGRARDYVTPPGERATPNSLHGRQQRVTPGQIGFLDPAGFASDVYQSAVTNLAPPAIAAATTLQRALTPSGKHLVRAQIVSKNPILDLLSRPLQAPGQAIGNVVQGAVSRIALRNHIDAMKGAQGMSDAELRQRLQSYFPSADPADVATAVKTYRNSWSTAPFARVGPELAEGAHNAMAGKSGRGIFDVAMQHTGSVTLPGGTVVNPARGAADIAGAIATDPMVHGGAKLLQMGAAKVAGKVMTAPGVVGDAARGLAARQASVEGVRDADRTGRIIRQSNGGLVAKIVPAANDASRESGSGAQDAANTAAKLPGAGQTIVKRMQTPTGPVNVVVEPYEGRPSLHDALTAAAKEGQIAVTPEQMEKFLALRDTGVGIGVQRGFAPSPFRFNQQQQIRVAADGSPIQEPPTKSPLWTQEARGSLPAQPPAEPGSMDELIQFLNAGESPKATPGTAKVEPAAAPAPEPTPAAAPTPAPAPATPNVTKPAKPTTVNVTVGTKTYRAKLTPEQAEQLAQAQAEHDQRIAAVTGDAEAQGAARKAAGMQLSAQKRAITGLITPIEAADQAQAAATLSAGQAVKVRVGDQAVDAQLLGQAYGKARIQYPDGSVGTVDRAAIARESPQPVTDAHGNQVVAVHPADKATGSDLLQQGYVKGGKPRNGYEVYVKPGQAPHPLAQPAAAPPASRAEGTLPGAASPSMSPGTAAPVAPASQGTTAPAAIAPQTGPSMSAEEPDPFAAMPQPTPDRSGMDAGPAVAPWLGKPAVEVPPPPINPNGSGAVFRSSKAGNFATEVHQAPGDVTSMTTLYPDASLRDLLVAHGRMMRTMLSNAEFAKLQQAMVPEGGRWGQAQEDAFANAFADAALKGIEPANAGVKARVDALLDRLKDSVPGLRAAWKPGDDLAMHPEIKQVFRNMMDPSAGGYKNPYDPATVAGRAFWSQIANDPRVTSDVPTRTHTKQLIDPQVNQLRKAYGTVSAPKEERIEDPEEPGTYVPITTMGRAPATNTLTQIEAPELFGPAAGKYTTQEAYNDLMAKMNGKYNLFGWQAPINSRYANLVGKVKGAYTMYSMTPRYALNNMVGDTISGLTAAAPYGVTPLQLARNLPGAAAEVRAGKGPTIDLLKRSSPILETASPTARADAPTPTRPGIGKAIVDATMFPQQANQVGLFKSLLDRGLTPEEAARTVELGTIDYGGAPQYVQYLGKTGIIPFGKYGWGMAKLAGQTLNRAPQFVPGALDARRGLYQSVPGSDDAADRLPDYQQGFATIPVGTARNGRPLFWNASGVAPFQGPADLDLGAGAPKSGAPSDVADTAWSTLTNSIPLGGPLQAMANRDGIGREIRPAGMNPVNASLNTLGTAAASFLPSGISSGVPRLYNAATGAPTVPDGMGGRRPQTIGEALVQNLTGVKLFQAPPAGGNNGELWRATQQLRKAMRDAAAAGGNNPLLNFQVQQQQDYVNHLAGQSAPASPAQSPSVPLQIGAPLTGGAPLSSGGALSSGVPLTSGPPLR